MAGKHTEFVELQMDKKWEYLQRYYQISSEFYDINDPVVTQKEVDDCIAGFKEKPVPQIRKELKLKEWHFNMDEGKNGVSKEYFSGNYDEKSWETVKLPHSIRYSPDNPERFGRLNIDATCRLPGEYCDIWRGEYHLWYKNRTDFGQIADDEMVYLNVDSINLFSDIWVNEHPVMLDHMDLFPYSIDITDEVKKNESGQKSALSVRVRNISSNVPFIFSAGFQFAYSRGRFNKGRQEDIDWLDQSWAGIAGGMTVQIVKKAYIESVFVTTEDIACDASLMKIKVKFCNAFWKRVNGKVRVEISKWIPEESKIITGTEKDITVLPMNEADYQLEFRIENPDLWDVDNPNMYLAHVVLIDEKGREIDDLYESFGVRTIKMIGPSFYLNNKKVILKGTHDTCAYQDESMICPGDSAIVKDILFHKKMGMNCSRWPSDDKVHYKKIADYCSQLGFMVMWEGLFDAYTCHPEMEMYRVRDVKNLVRDLRNFPGIIIWEMGDETLNHAQKDFRRFKWNRLVYDLVISEDDSRPIMPNAKLSNDLVEMIENFPDKDLSYEERRKRILDEFPIFNLPLVYRDWHCCPENTGSVGRSLDIADLVGRTLDGDRPVHFSEFGFSGMPEWDKVKDVYGGFRWTTCARTTYNRKICDEMYLGRVLNAEDWRESQSAQAIVLSALIGYLQEEPDRFAAISFCAMFDDFTFFWGPVDAGWNPKLAYFVLQNQLRRFYISGLHGNTVLKDGDSFDIVIGNMEDVLENATLKVLIKDKDDNQAMVKIYRGVSIKGGICMNKTGAIDVAGIEPGLYSIEYYLAGPDGGQLAKGLELFFKE